MSRPSVERAAAVDDDGIYIVPSKSPGFPKKSESMGAIIKPEDLKFARVIPFHSKIETVFYGGRSTRKEFRGMINLLLRVDLGLTLRYKKTEWRETTDIEVYIRPEEAEQIAKDIIRTLKRKPKSSATATATTEDDHV